MSTDAQKPDTTRAADAIHRAVVVFEVEGGNDKTIHGNRVDTQPILDALRAQGWHAEVVVYRPEWSDKLFDYVSGSFDAYISRVNPGNIPGGEEGYFALLERLADAGLAAFSRPAEMLAYGAKDALLKLNDTPLVPADTTAYYDVDSFRQAFPISLASGERVLKQNRGSTGEGIWRVQLADESARPGSGQPVAGDAQVTCTEAVDNHTETHTLAEFMTQCEAYLEGDNGMLVDMRFLPRIVEGEIRVLVVGDTPVSVIHKKPAAGGNNFSATLFSGAHYTHDAPEAWPDLLAVFDRFRPVLAERLGGELGGTMPLLWTADFILADGDDGAESVRTENTGAESIGQNKQARDAYVLGEINCSCVGFSSQLESGIQEKIAAEVISRVEARAAKAAKAVKPANS